MDGGITVTSIEKGGHGTPFQVAATTCPFNSSLVYLGHNGPLQFHSCPCNRIRSRSSLHPYPEPHHHRTGCLQAEFVLRLKRDEWCQKYQNSRRLQLKSFHPAHGPPSGRQPSPCVRPLGGACWQHRCRAPQLGPAPAQLASHYRKVRLQDGPLHDLGAIQGDLCIGGINALTGELHDHLVSIVHDV